MQNTSHTSRSGGFSFGGLPDVLLDGIFDYSGLPEIAACAAASVELRVGLRRLSPALERRLVVRRFPILSAVIGDGATDEAGMPSPRELFLSQEQLFDETGAVPYAPHNTLNDYGFVAELELATIEHDPVEDHYFVASRESIFVGKGQALGNRADIRFNIPGGVFIRAWPATEWHVPTAETRVSLRVMATRGRYSRARLGQGDAFDCEEENKGDSRGRHGHGRRIHFENMGLMQHGETAENSEWMRQTANHYIPEMFDDPHTHPEIFASWEVYGWNFPPYNDPDRHSTIRVEFRWSSQSSEDVQNMTAAEVAIALERHVNWTS